MFFFNVQTGDAPYLKSLADNSTMTTITIRRSSAPPAQPRHARFRQCDPSATQRATPPPRRTTRGAGNAFARLNSALSEIENPNPHAGNQQLQDGYGGGSESPTATPPNANYGGGSYVNCSNPSEPGIALERSHATNEQSIKPNCEPGHYYLSYNYTTGISATASNAYTDTHEMSRTFDGGTVNT